MFASRSFLDFEDWQTIAYNQKPDPVPKLVESMQSYNPLVGHHAVFPAIRMPPQLPCMFRETVSLSHNPWPAMHKCEQACSTTVSLLKAAKKRDTFPFSLQSGDQGPSLPRHAVLDSYSNSLPLAGGPSSSRSCPQHCSPFHPPPALTIWPDSKMMLRGKAGLGNKKVTHGQGADRPPVRKRYPAQQKVTDVLESLCGLPMPCQKKNFH